MHDVPPDDIVKLVHTSGGNLIDASASNWASMNPDSVVESIEADPVRWEHFLNNEQAACACRGAWDGGTHAVCRHTNMNRPCTAGADRAQ
jgi:hypothetical protein